MGGGRRGAAGAPAGGRDGALTGRRIARVVVGVDGSPSGEAALLHAVALACGLGAAIVAVHVRSVADVVYEHAPGELRLAPVGAAADPVLRDARETAAAAGVDAALVERVGWPPEQIAALAEEVAADLVVVGSQRRGRLARLLLGSTSAELLDRTDRPVLVVSAAGSCTSRAAGRSAGTSAAAGRARA